MRLRHCLLLATFLGAIGALLLAADLYRHLRALEFILSFGETTEAHALVLGTMHVLGMAGLGFVFLAVFLMLLVPADEPVAVKPSSAPAAKPAGAVWSGAVVVADPFLMVDGGSNVEAAVAPVEVVASPSAVAESSSIPAGCEAPVVNPDPGVSA